ncbi:MAG: ABC transporter permease [Oscillospiraceae bacterium]|nr:ABC transporter permease [Oscillospiraceae bacterium]
MKQVFRRLGMLLLTMIIVSFFTFLAFELVSGDPALARLGTEATPEQLEALREEMGLNRNFLLRYADWLSGFFTGDLGESYVYRIPVWTLIAPKLEVTLLLAFMSFVLITVISLPLGIWSYRLSGGVPDAIGTCFNQLCMAIPPFFVGILFSWLFGILLRFFTPGNFPDLHSSFGAAFRHLFFAALCLSIPRSAMTVRMMRSTVIGEMQKAYVRTAISRGNDRRGVMLRHVLKNTLTGTITFLAQTMAEIIGASVVVEQVFGIPGLGRLLVASISNRDYPVVQVIVVLLAFWVVLAGTIADILNQKIDPRLRLGGDSE